MPNTIPIPELIALEIVSRLEQITLENGYEFDVSEVVRPTRKGENWKLKHFGIGIQQMDSERTPDLDCPGNPPALAFTIGFGLYCVCKDSKNLDQPRATNENTFAAAVMKAIVDDGSMWQTMNDNAIDTRFGSPSPFLSPEGENDGVLIPLQVLYRVSETNPFEVRA